MLRGTELTKKSAVVIAFAFALMMVLATVSAYADEDGYYYIPENKVVLTPHNNYVSWEDMNGSSDKDYPIYIKYVASTNGYVTIDTSKSKYSLSPSFAARQRNYDNRIPLWLTYDRETYEEYGQMYEDLYYTSRASLFLTQKNTVYYMRVNGGKSGHIKFNSNQTFVKWKCVGGMHRVYSESIRKGRTYGNILISSYGDCDGDYSIGGKEQVWYHFNQKKTGTVSIRLSAVHSSRRHATVYLYKGSRLVAKKSMGRNTSIRIKKRLKKGKYYIKVVGENTPYKIKVM